MTPAEVLGARVLDPFCANGVLATIHELADASHSKPIADLIAEGRWRAELLLTLGRSAPPRYANFIGRFRDDPDASVRQAVAVALGRIENAAVSVPLLIHLLARGEGIQDFPVKWGAAGSLVALARRGRADGVRRRLLELFHDTNAMTVALAARALAGTGDARGLVKLRELTAHGEPRVRQEALLALGEAADRGARAEVTRRLKDENLAVRACAVYALARIGGPAAVPVLRTAIDQALDEDRALERRKQGGEDPRALDAKYGRGEFDLRETLQEAIAAATTGRP
ncbi:MAG: HEAT repeat domain-containing protein [Candidatus Rokubacteria bacterium]|nr:HEAT repeat domain-containing protein [Candidatus Rokubacteria bacterium]